MIQENEAFLTEQLITYIGNKRKLLGFIGEGVEHLQKRLNKNRITAFDAFSGSGIVSRYLKKYASTLYVNDLEDYARVINNCYLANSTPALMDELTEHYNTLMLDIKNPSKGFISELYSPKNDQKIETGERAFYTTWNACFIDTARKAIDHLPENIRHFFLAPLLAEASVHTNTAGVFKGFYKDSNTGIGKFGGKNANALSRIMGNIELKMPIFSNFHTDTHILQGDTNIIAKELPEVDLVYLDPPYNQHPYGSNYFMLNLIAKYQKPENISKISGIPMGWNRSDYNKQAEACAQLSELVHNLNAKFVLISFNSEGFISLDEMTQMLSSAGKVKVNQIKYNAFRGSRNLAERDVHLREYLYILEK